MGNRHSADYKMNIVRKDASWGKILLRHIMAEQKDKSLTIQSGSLVIVTLEEGEV